ncbi:hypothetical protein FH972_025410 [Carpinus fangiana]|uniref:Uncharacterized protein n=1 Tax=Carpinus fangiana TaxID=176857 RepID=A0A5N6L0Y6_9ROSI|nr:hypothetical protein FH972_025410 [Carpinus fangiana]
MPWHTPRHAIAPTKAHLQTLDLKLGTPSKCLIMNLEAHFGQMAWAKKNLCGVDSFWHAMVHTKACHGTHQGTLANLGFEALETFQMSYNEL